MFRSPGGWQGSSPLLAAGRGRSFSTAESAPGRERALPRPSAKGPALLGVPPSQTAFQAFLTGKKPLYLFRLTSCAIPRRYLNLSNDQFQSRILNCSLTYNNFGAGIIIWNKIVPTIHYFREITKGKKQTPKQTTKLHAAERKCPSMILFPL